jgi:hypothetical protein
MRVAGFPRNRSPMFILKSHLRSRLPALTPTPVLYIIPPLLSARYLFNESMHQQGTPISKVTKALTPDSIAVPGFEGKAGIVSLSVNPGTLELNANNPYNNNDVFSRDASATFLGFGGSVTQRTYDLGETWMTTYDFASDFGADKSGGIIYKTGVGFKGLGLNWKYDIDINIVDMFLGKPAY